ncbi:MAG: autotransporter outer membrane beta-barrel domain-containing protein [Verrucomicrobiales bacterium]|jgi:outer membrane autotransporter protein|nr:autotransporter outer membrane beta-barrel domain-containing protein [Verrucomicrobiales bacterium]
MKYYSYLIGGALVFAAVLLQPAAPCAAADVYWGESAAGMWTTGSWRVQDPSGTWRFNPQPTGTDNAIVQNAPDPSTVGSVTVSAGTSGIARDVIIGKANLGFLTIEGVLSNTNAIIGEIVGAAGSGVTVSGTGFWRNSGTLTVGRDGSLTSTLAILNTGSVSAVTSIVGEIMNSNGVVTIGGTGLFNAGVLTVGQSGNGGVTVSGNGTVVSANATLGNATGASGAVSVGDSGVWRTGNFIIGNSGAGVFTLTDNASGTSTGATIGANAGSTGDATVSDGARWLNNGALTVGVAGVGTLTVSDHATGTNSGALTVGQSGTGTLTLTDSATFTNGAAVIGANANSLGTVNISGSVAWTNNGALTVGQSGTGVVTITGSNIVTTSGNLTVGQSGAGALTVSGENILTNNNLIVGQNGSGVGEITIGGTATWTNSGSVTVGQSGTGTVKLSENITVTSTGAAVVGANDNSFGAITIGDNATWANAGNFTVGQSGAGTLTLSGNAVVSNSAAIIGDTAGGVGTVSVDGNAQWRNSGTFKVGNSGTGKLTISGNAFVETRDADIGYDKNANGVGTVSGSAFWQIKTDPAAGYEGALFIGHGTTATDAPAGTLNITESGSVSAGHSYVGYNASGAVNVSGSGFWNSGDLYLGAHGDGALNITDSGSVTSGVAAISDAHVGANGTVSIDGNGLWLVTGGTLQNNDGGHLVLADSGSVIVSGTYTQSASALLTFTLSDTSAKIVADGATVSGTLTIAGFTGTLADTASLVQSTTYTLIHTAGPGNLSGRFDEVNFSEGFFDDIPDYITSLGAYVDSGTRNYMSGFKLSWDAATVEISATRAHGDFTVADDVSFDVDVPLNDVAENPDKNWDGKSLTKNGPGTLTLSASNNFSGTTTVNAGLLNISGWTGSNAAGVIDSGTVNVSGAWLVSEDITVTNGALLVSGGTVSGGTALNVTDGELTVTGGLLDSLAAVVDNSVATVSGGTWNSATLDFTGTLDVSGSGLVNSDTLAVNAGSVIIIAESGTMTNAAAKVNAREVIVSGGVWNSATLGFTGILNVTGSGLLDTGTLTVNAGSVVTVAESGTVKSVEADVNAREVSVSGQGYLEASQLAVSDSLSITGSGVVKSETADARVTSVSGSGYLEASQLTVSDNLSVTGSGVVKSEAADVRVVSVSERGYLEAARLTVSDSLSLTDSGTVMSEAANASMVNVNGSGYLKASQLTVSDSLSVTGSGVVNSGELTTAVGGVVTVTDSGIVTSKTVDASVVRVSGSGYLEVFQFKVNDSLSVTGSGVVNSVKLTTAANSVVAVTDSGVVMSEEANASVVNVNGSGYLKASQLTVTDSLSVTGSGVVNSGGLTAAAGSVVTVADSGTVTSEAAVASVVNVSGRGYLEAARLTVSDTLSVTGNGVVKGDTLTMNTAKLLLAGGAVLRADETVVNGGTVAIVSKDVRLQNTAGAGRLTISGYGATVLLDHRGDFTFDSKVVGNTNIKLVSGITTFAATDSTHSGTVSVSAGALLRAGSANVISQNADVSLAGGGAFDLNNFSQRFRNLNVSGGGIDFGGTGGALAVSRLDGDGTWHFYADTGSGARNTVSVSAASSGRERVILNLSGNETADPRAVLAGMIDDPYQAVWQFDDFHWGLFDYSAAQTANTLTLTQHTTSASAGIGSIAEVQRRAWFTQQSSLVKRMGDLRLKIARERLAADDDVVMKNLNAQIDQMFADLGVPLPPRQQETPATVAETARSFVENVWMRGFGAQQNVRASVSGMAFDETVYGFDVGADHAWNIGADDVLVTGLFLGYNGGSADFKGAGVKTDLHGYHGGLYLSWLTDNGWYVDAVAKGAVTNSDLSAPLIGRATSVDADGAGVGASVEFGKRFDFTGGWFVEPQAQIAALHLMTDDFTFGSLNIKAKDLDAVQLRAGVTGGRTFALNGGRMVQVYGRVAGVEELSSGGEFRSGAQKVRADSDGARAELGGGLIYQIDAHNQLHLDYEAGFGAGYTSPWGLNGGYRYQF